MGTQQRNELLYVVSAFATLIYCLYFILMFEQKDISFFTLLLVPSAEAGNMDSLGSTKQTVSLGPTTKC